MRLAKISIILFGLSLLFSACNQKEGEFIVGSYGKYDVKLPEFEKAYAKNAGGIDKAKQDSLQEYKKFLDLFMNYKMKLRNAEVRGYPEDQNIINEAKEYRRTVGKTFLIERKILDKNLKLLYDRRKFENRVSHIMIKSNAVGLKVALKKARNIIDSLKNGADWDLMAQKYSDDTYSKSKGGDIYFLSAGQLSLPSFEDAMYAATPGEVYPEPVVTKFGVHIIKVKERRPAKYKIRARHILIDFKDETGQINEAKAKIEVDSIYAKIKNGEDFGKLAQIYSNDPGSGSKGGDLGYFTRRMMVKEFDEAVFNLKLNEISDIVKTKFGYHIIQLTGIEDFPSFETEKENLKTLYKKYRYDYDYKKFIENLGKKHNLKINEKNLKTIAEKGEKSLFSTYDQADWKNELKDLELFSLEGKSFSLDSSMAKVAKEKSFQAKIMGEAQLRELISFVSENPIIDSEVDVLESENTEFADLMDEYRNGIYIFKLQEEEVWDKISVDSTKLFNYWSGKKADYMWPNRVEFSEIYSKSDSLINIYYSELQTGGNFDTLAYIHTERRGFKTKNGYHGTVEVSKSELAALAFTLNSEGEYSKPVKMDDGWVIVKLIKKYPATEKTFEEARAEVASQYQEDEGKRLDNEFTNSLRKIYQPEVFYDVLEKAFNEKQTN